MRKDAVSEIVGTVLLLAMAVSLFAVLHIIIFNSSINENTSTPSAMIVASLRNQTIILEHHGGESLSIDNTKIMITIGGEEKIIPLNSTFFKDENHNGKWDIGEEIIYIPSEDISGLEVDSIVIDKPSNSLLFTGTLQSGSTKTMPSVTTLDATDITSDSAKLWMEYYFRGYTGFIRFLYKPIGGNWVNTTWTSASDTGKYSEIITNLSSNTYIFKAQLLYNSTIVDGEEKTFTVGFSLNTMVDQITPHTVAISPLTINATGSSSLDKVSLWYRYSKNNGSSDWWNNSWTKRRSITLKTNKDSTSANYQIMINITYDSDMKKDFSDLRFINYPDNKTELPYWIENKKDQQWAKIWIKIPYQITTTPQKIWLYYGNNNAKSKSNGKETFEFFDDFNNLSNWNYDSKFVSVKNGVVSIRNAPGCYNPLTEKTRKLTIPLILESKLKYISSSTNYNPGFDILLPDSTASRYECSQLKGNWYLFSIFTSNGDYLRYWRHKVTSYTLQLNKNYNINLNEYHKFMFVVSPKWKLETYVDGNLISKFTGTNFGTINGYLGWREGSIDIDYLFVRKYASEEPTITLGVEENNTGIATSWMKYQEDTSYPWQWTFDFPNGTGYYEFYSIGWSGIEKEVTPDIADASCYYNPAALLDTHVNTIIPYRVITPSITINATGSSQLDDVILYYRYSKDNKSWGSDWWSSDWSKRKLITLKTNSGSTPANYQITINITYDSDMKTDFSDLRFINYPDNKTELPYWIENKKDQQWAKIWIKIPYQITTTPQKIWLYYGNNNAKSKSNGKETFEFFDDFNESKIDTSTWRVDTTDYTIQNSILRINKGAISIENPLTFNLNDGYILEGKIRYVKKAPNYSGTLSAQSSHYTQGSNHGGDATNLYMRLGNSKTVSRWTGRGNSKSYNCGYSTVFVSQDNVWYILGEEFTPTGVTLTKNRVKQITTSCSWTKNLKYISLGAFYGGVTYNIQDTEYDWVLVRKYSNIETTITIGVEEEDTQSWMKYQEDTSYPWQWTFDFPNGTGYYEFYSIGEYGDDVEDKISSEEARCRYTSTLAVSQWHLDEGTGSIAYDNISDNDGKIYGASWTTGIKGKALQFKGGNNYIIINPVDSFPTDKISVEFWMKSSDKTKKGTPFSYASPASDNDFLIYNYNNLMIYRGGHYVKPKISLTDGKWHHIVVTWNSNDGKTILYKDGEAVYTGTLAKGTKITPSGSLVIAREQDKIGGGFDSSQDFIGYMDEIAVYDRILSPSEVKEHYNSTKPSIIAQWHLNEGTGSIIYDSVSDNDGKIYGASWTTGINGSALSFDGKNDYVNIPDSSDLNPSGDFSAEVWFKANKLSTWQGVVSKLTNVNPGNGRGWNIQIGTAENIASLIADSSGHYVYLKTSWKPSTNTWYHVVLVHHSSNNKNELYVNGKLEATNTHGIAFTNNPVQIGKFYTNSNSLYFNGIIDEIAIYSKALTSEEIKEKYEKTKSTIVAKWTLNEGNGNIVHDSIGSNDGKIYGATWTTGINGSALSFDGKNDYVEVSYSDNLALNTWSFEAWVMIKTSKYTNGVIGTRFGSDYTFDIKFKYTQGWHGDIGDGSKWLTTSADYLPGGIKLNEWYHLVYVVQPNRCDIYVNGEHKKTITYSGTPLLMKKGQVMKLGNSYNTEYGNVLIDEPCIYSKALSAEEIKGHYNNFRKVIARWHLNEGTGNIAYDNIGDNNGKINGASWTTGINGSALSFDGKNDYIQISNNNLNPTDKLTIVAWIKWNIKPSSGQHWANIIDKNGDNEWQLQHSYHNDKFEFAVKTEYARKYVQSTTKPENGKWYQIVGVYDGSHIKIYVNGKLEKSTTLTGKIKVSNSDINIGRRTWKDRYFNGVIDEVSVYNKALTDEEIKDLYNKHGG